MKRALYAFILLLICLVMVSGLTLSFFTGLSSESEMHFTVGKVEVDIEDISTANGNWDDWKPGIENAKNISCTLVNSGSMKSHLRVQIGRTWNPDKSKAAGGSPEVTLVQTGSTVWTEENGIWYYPTIVEPGERVTFNFDVYLDSINGYLGEKYNLTLNVEAVQAVNDTIPIWD